MSLHCVQRSLIVAHDLVKNGEVTTSLNLNDRVGSHVASGGSLKAVLLTQKVFQTLVKANLRPKNFCLGIIRLKVSFYKCLGYFLYW